MKHDITNEQGFLNDKGRLVFLNLVKEINEILLLADNENELRMLNGLIAKCSGDQTAKLNLFYK